MEIIVYSDDVRFPAEYARALSAHAPSQTGDDPHGIRTPVCRYI